MKKVSNLIAANSKLLSIDFKRSPEIPTFTNKRSHPTQPTASK
jgi:hypothetical protein